MDVISNNVLKESPSPTEWQNQFGKRLSSLRAQLEQRFAKVAVEQLAPAFADLEIFLTSGGIDCSALTKTRDSRAYGFMLGEECGTEVTFHLTSGAMVEARCRIVSAAGDRPWTTLSTVALARLSAGWATLQFRTALDRMLDAAESAAGTVERKVTTAPVARTLAA